MKSQWLREDRITAVCYTDGSWKKMPGGVSHGGWAARVIFSNGTISELHGGVKNTTNNRMELLAVIKALQFLPDGCNAYVYTDSRYVQKGILYWIASWKKRDWINMQNKPVANQDLWKLMDQETRRHLVSWHWVRGHDGDKHNERCDRLAYEARMHLLNTPDTHGA
jgi:ribonuclease HI